MMSKTEIMSTTLDQLIEKFSLNPESFEYVGADSDRPNLKPYIELIAWQTKVESNDKLVPDPSAFQRTILVTFSSQDNSLSIRIYNSTFTNVHAVDGMTPDGFLETRRLLERYRSNYKKFAKLKRLILTQHEHKKTKEFMAKLSSVFPTILDHFIIGR